MGIINYCTSGVRPDRTGHRTDECAGGPMSPKVQTVGSDAESVGERRRWLGIVLYTAKNGEGRTSFCFRTARVEKNGEGRTSFCFRTAREEKNGEGQNIALL
ncbi:hypothetical protein EV702DRAFT_1044101 [Suillus placidus]|uniref:Uncharacterized protein n=1 Tax=Suillus placidus TaxID=48579 RepID=A0A9P7D4H9_9AGAM|nr:hypothetical protein EV702DRAFT_1044101 [Suillus placidus]